mgnify:CR=1 FL=1
MTDTRPAHLRVAADLRAKIMAGTIAPGARLPSTGELMKYYEAANTTIQAAIRALKDEGFVRSHPGKGVFARRDGMITVDVAAYYDPATRGVTYTLLDVAEVQAPADVADALGEERAVLRHRRTDRDGKPVELSWSYYPLSIVAGTPLTRRAKIRGGAPRVLADLGYPQRLFIDRVSARPPTTEEAEQLGIPQGVPVIRQLRVIYSDNKKPVEVSVIVKPGHLYELRYRQAIPADYQ